MGFQERHRKLGAPGAPRSVFAPCLLLLVLFFLVDRPGSPFFQISRALNFHGKLCGRGRSAAAAGDAARAESAAQLGTAGVAPLRVCA